jgi:hypothetical protein
LGLPFSSDLSSATAFARTSQNGDAGVPVVAPPLAEAKEGPMTTVWIYVDTKYLPGHPDYVKVFANPVAADEWCKENDL